MNFAITLAGHRAHRASISMPARGLWTARLDLDEEITLAIGSSATIGIGDRLQLTGAIVRGDKFAGTSRYLVRAGRGGWQKIVKERGYRSDGGVKVATVLRDAAIDAGEVWASTLPTTTIGPAFARFRAPAVRVVTELLGGAWYVDDDGRTQPTTRPESTFEGEVLNVDMDARVADLATTAPEKVRPRCTVPGIGRVTAVYIQATATKVSLRASGELS